MKILLSGYGKMGKTIERIASNKKHEVVHKLNSTPTRPQLQEVDVVVDFSTPDAAFINAKTVIESIKPIVMGTTGWRSYYDNIEELVKQNNGKFLYAANFSIGVNLFFHLNQELAKLMHPYQGYKPYLQETHHTEKLDAPSGTAIHLAEELVDKKLVNNWKYPGKKANADELPVDAHRQEDVKGIHELSYESNIDSISIKHEAKTRDGFALGAVIAAEWLYQQQNTGVYTMQDVLQEPIKY
jgi:4-hydroxy-tetrahydrodipicolinate reductase